jgi:AraC-like DNA-binding protein
MMRNVDYNRCTDCAQCPKAAEGKMVYRKFERGKHFPADKCTQNFILMVLEGELLINSQEYPGTTLKGGNIVLQAIGSKVELLALTDVEYIIYWFNELPKICERRCAEIMNNQEAPLTYTPLVMSMKFENFVCDLRDYLREGMSCGPYIELKCKELVFILTSYYPLPQLRTFFYPISSYTESFHYFVMKNYEKVKNVEEFAHLGGYSITTFRRLFKNMYGVPVYEWMLSRKREGILYDLQNSRERIGEISKRYGFDTMSHFAHFCKSSFGDTPRSLRNKFARGEHIEVIGQK